MTFNNNLPGHYIVTFAFISLFLFFSHQLVQSTKVSKEVLLSHLTIQNRNCTDASIVQKNITSQVILTGTVTECQLLQAGSYACTIQVWRVMKGKHLIGNLMSEREELPFNSYFTPSKFVNVYGLGKSVYCKSNVKIRDTKIFFLNRVKSRLLLSASFLRVTLLNLRNTQSVIEGQKIVERSSFDKDPCHDVMCGYGGHCQDREGVAVCVCPDRFCGSFELNTLAPVCGSNKITYINHCYLKLAQCLDQRHIRVASPSSCDSWSDDDLCSGVVCRNSAVCRVRLVSGGVRKARCECPTCSNRVEPVCGSDLRSYASACHMEREACIHETALFVTRKTPCSPCEVYNSSKGDFDRICTGECAYDDIGGILCCDHIDCSPDPAIVCGSDGNTYESVCALKKFACKFGRNITVLQEGPCPRRRMMTKMRGSIPVKVNQCPDCDLDKDQFEKIRKKFVNSVNLELRSFKSTGKALGDFRIVEARSDDSTLVFEMSVSTDRRPISVGDDPWTRYSWAINRLYNKRTGVFQSVLPKYSFSLDESSDPADDVIVEDVCLHRQCHHGQVCSILRTFKRRLLPVCSCSGAGEKLAVTSSCKRATSGVRYPNKVSSRRAMCESKTFFTYHGTCSGKPSSQCGRGGCEWPGEACVVANGVGECRCVACDETLDPVCASNGESFKSQCELERHNCQSRDRLQTDSKGVCATSCDVMNCSRGSQCEEAARGGGCYCPRECVDVEAPVCGSDCKTYQSRCHLAAESCLNGGELNYLHEGACRFNCAVQRKLDDECFCEFGAVCDVTGSCSCSIDCSAEPLSPVCASNRRTYRNQCEVSLASCEQQQLIYVIANMSCEDNCQLSAHGCCADGVIQAQGAGKAGCPEVCKCDKFGSYSGTCHAETGQCTCRPGVEGNRCNACKLGFWNFQALIDGKKAGCTACHCDYEGSIRDDCDPLTGRCMCKEGYQGLKCSLCVQEDDCAGIVPKSCKNSTCLFNQDCVSLQGGFSCTCPPPSSCDNYTGDVVCGSDGLSYANICHMRAITCRRGVNARVLAYGLCRDLKVDLNLTPSTPTSSPSSLPHTFPMNLPTTTQSEPTSHNGTEPQIVSQPPTHLNHDVTTAREASSWSDLNSQLENTSEIETSTHFVTSPGYIDHDGNETSLKTTIVNGSIAVAKTTFNPKIIESTPTPGGSGGGCEWEDDEDCNNVSTPSNMGTDLTTTNFPFFTSPSSVPTTSLSPSRRAVHHYAGGNFAKIGSNTLRYQSELSNSQSQLYQNYSDLVLAKMMDYVNNPLLFGKINSVSITSFGRSSTSNPRNGGVNVGFDLYVNQGVNVKEVLGVLNQLSNHTHAFHLRGDSEPGESAISIFTPPSNYTEGEIWTTPQFGGRSYFLFPLIEKVTSSMTIRMRFRTFDGEGLLIYAAHHQPSNDFVSLSIKKGRVEFRFNTGSGTLRLRSKVDVTKRSRRVWHSLVAHRNRRDGMLRVDGEQARQGTTPKGTSGLNVDPELYVGGFPPAIQPRLVQQVEVKKGLTGCIRRLSIRGRTFPIDSSSRNASYRIGNCQTSPCFPNLCGNSVNCFIKEHKNKLVRECDCDEGQGGTFCQESLTDKEKSDPCLNHLCHPSSNCTPHTRAAGGYDCACANGRSGMYCQDEEDQPEMDGPSFMPAFAGDSFLLRPSLGRGVKSAMRIDLVFYSSQPNGLIFYNGHKRFRDFVALNLRSQHLEFLYDLGNGLARIRSPQNISLNEWHKVSLSRNMRMGAMVIDGGDAIKGQSPKFLANSVTSHDSYWKQLSIYSRLNVNQPLYLGGFPNYTSLSRDSGINEGFVGALQQFSVNGEKIPLSMKDADFYNVQPFNAHPCFHKPCRNEGTCHPYLSDFACVCAKQWGGNLCEINMTVDELLQRDQPHTGFYFDGKVKGKYRNNVKHKRSITHNAYELHVTTRAERGILLLVGKPMSSAPANRDYLLLAIANGRLHLQFDLGSGPSHIVSENRINHGGLSVIKVERSGRIASLQINEGMMQQVEAPGGSVELNADGFLWIGGVDRRPRGIGLSKSFFRPFIGCLSLVSIYNEPIQLKKDALNSPSFARCA